MISYKHWTKATHTSLTKNWHIHYHKFDVATNTPRFHYHSASVDPNTTDQLRTYTTRASRLEYICSESTMYTCYEAHYQCLSHGEAPSVTVTQFCTSFHHTDVDVL